MERGPSTSLRTATNYVNNTDHDSRSSAFSLYTCSLLVSSTETVSDIPGTGRVLSKYVCQPGGRWLERFIARVTVPESARVTASTSISIGYTSHGAIWSRYHPNSTVQINGELFDSLHESTTALSDAEIQWSVPVPKWIYKRMLLQNRARALHYIITLTLRNLRMVTEACLESESARARIAELSSSITESLDECLTFLHSYRRKNVICRLSGTLSWKRRVGVYIVTFEQWQNLLGNEFYEILEESGFDADEPTACAEEEETMMTEVKNDQLKIGKVLED